MTGRTECLTWRIFPAGRIFTLCSRSANGTSATFNNQLTALLHAAAAVQANEPRAAVNDKSYRAASDQDRIAKKN
jgi:hypothetical protein